MRMRRQTAIREEDATAIEEAAVGRDSDEHRRVTVLGDADGRGLPGLPSRHDFLRPELRLHCSRSRVHPDYAEAERPRPPRIRLMSP